MIIYVAGDKRSHSIRPISFTKWWMGDHLPKHVHVYKNGREIAKVEIPSLLILKGKIDNRIRKILQELIEEGEI